MSGKRSEAGAHLQALSRRCILRIGAAGIAGLFAGRESRAGAGRTTGTARAIIQLWMNGGPSHIDTFDPKPEAGADYCGPYRKAIKTNVPGIRLCETLPKLAGQADKFAIIRSMTHGINGHETATYVMQTGFPPGGELVYPAIGAVVALKVGPRGSLPPYVTITSPLGRFSEAGFLGPAYKPFATGGDPNAKRFVVQGLVAPGGVSEQRLLSRRSLLEALDGLEEEIGPDQKLRKADEYRRKAYELILGKAKKAFDLSEEDPALRERYGRNRYGQSFLLARRLVENGVPFATVNWGGWDTHKQHFEKMASMLPILDQAFSALLEDLSARGLLDETIVFWGGEFGRTPKIAKEPPWNGGRHHFGAAFSCVVAGGGFKGGTVVGSTDRTGEHVRSRPVYPWDLTASIYTLLGIDPLGRLPHPRGCVARVTPLGTGEVPSGGLLWEIMPPRERIVVQR